MQVYCVFEDKNRLVGGNSVLTLVRSWKKSSFGNGQLLIALSLLWIEACGGAFLLARLSLF
jgi:hypothetical protein